MASRRESRAHSTGLNTLQEFENLRKTFKASNDRLAKKNNELLGQISLLNKQLQENAAENFELRGALSALQRQNNSDKSRMLAFERERQCMLDLVEETTRANDWARKNLASLRRSFDLLEKEPASPPILIPAVNRPRSSISSAVVVSKPPDMELIHEVDSEDESTSHTSHKQRSSTQRPRPATSRLASVNMINPIETPMDTPSLSSTPATSSRASIRRPIRRQSGLLTPFQFRPRSSSSPPPSAKEATDADDGDGFTLNEFDALVPISTNIPTPPDHIPSTRVKDKGKRKTSLNVAATPTPVGEQGQQQNEEPNDRVQQLHDLTNSPPPPNRTVIERRSKKNVAAAMVSEQPDNQSSNAATAPPPRAERRRKITSLVIDEDAEIDDRGESTATDSKGRKPSAKEEELAAVPIATSTRPSRPHSPIPLAHIQVPTASEGEGGRERRVRKSVNYAEPKLNTKMRKPDGYGSSSSARLSSSVSAAPSSSSSPPPLGDPALAPARKRRLTADVNSNPPATSSSPLGDVDEPRTASERERERERIKANKRAFMEDDDNEGPNETNKNMNANTNMNTTGNTIFGIMGENGMGLNGHGLWHDSSARAKSGIKTLSKRQSTSVLDASSPAGFPTAVDAVPSTMARKRKTPSGVVDLVSDEEEEVNAEADGYEDDGDDADDDDFRLPLGISGRRKSVSRSRGLGTSVNGRR